MRSLRARLNTAFVIPTAVIVLVLVAVAYLAARQGLEDELGQRLVEVAQVMAVDMSEGIDASQISRLDPSMRRVGDRLQQRLQDVREATEARRIFIVDRNAGALVDTDEETVFGDTLYRIGADRREVDTAFEEAIPTAGPLFQTDQGQYHKTAYAPILYEGEVVAVIGVEASATYFDLLTGFTTVLTLLGALGVLVVIGIGVWFSKIVTRPVDTLVEAAGRLAEGQMETPVVADGPRSWTRTEELDFLMTSFEEMRQSIVERDRQMQMMLAGIAHEVRNPLGGMELFCGLLKEDLAGEEDDEQRQKKIDMIERIEREIDYLERVVNNFLDFASAEEMERERVDAAELVDEIFEVVDADAEQAGCDLAKEIEEGVELTVDAGRMRRALINVVRNACQASKDQGGPVLVRCHCREGERRIEVVDHGCGIPQDKRDEMCKPFYTTREKGSGLGLALTRQIVEDHGGRLEIDSREGEGTTVRFELPFDDSVEADRNASHTDEIPEGWLG